MKILRNLCLHFARQDGQDGKKNRKKITQLKWPNYQKPKDENMGWTKVRMNKKFKTFLQISRGAELFMNLHPIDTVYPILTFLSS